MKYEIWMWTKSVLVAIAIIVVIYIIAYGVEHKREKLILVVW